MDNKNFGWSNKIITLTLQNFLIGIFWLIQPNISVTFIKFEIIIKLNQKIWSSIKNFVNEKKMIFYELKI